MSNIGYRTFNGTTDALDVTLGNLASGTQLGTWMYAGRLLSQAADGEIIHGTAPGWDPLDWYLASATPRVKMFDGAGDSNGPTWGTANGDVVIVVRMAGGANPKWSIVSHNGTTWGSWAHSTDGGTTFSSRNFASSGNLEIGNTAALNMRCALIARSSNAALSDAAVEALAPTGTTAGPLSAWTGLSGITNVWRMDQTPVVDLVGSSSQASITGTSVTAAGFPLDDGGVTPVTNYWNPRSIRGPGFNRRFMQRWELNDRTPASDSASGAIGCVEANETVAVTGGHGALGTIGAVEANETVAMSGTAGSYILSDDFPGSSIDSTKWTVYDRLGDQVNAEVNAVIPANVTVSSGTLKIDSKFEDVSAGDTTTSAPNPRTVHYTSGQVAMRGAPFLYGRVEVRAKICGNGTGTWPCIWMLGHAWQRSQPFTANTPEHDWPNGPWWELDIAEFMQGHRTLQNCALHFVTANRGGSGEKTIPFDSSSRFMVYRLDWTSTSLTWYIDAEDGNGWVQLLQITGTAGTDIPNTPGYLIIHTAIGGAAAETPVSGTFPVTMEVDYARISLDATSPDNSVIDITQANETVAIVGSFSTTGSIAVTESNETVAAVGTAGATGTIGVVEASETVAVTANRGATGSIAITEANETAAVAGTHSVSGAIAITEANETPAIVGSSVRGTIAITDIGETVAATAAHGVSGPISVSDSNETVAISGSFNQSGVTGTIGVSETVETVALVGSSAAGSLAVTETSEVVALTARHGITGTVGVADVAESVTVTGSHGATGTITITETSEVAAVTAGHGARAQIAVVDLAELVAVTGTFGTGPPAVLIASVGEWSVTYPAVAGAWTITPVAVTGDWEVTPA